MKSLSSKLLQMGLLLLVGIILGAGIVFFGRDLLFENGLQEHQGEKQRGKTGGKIVLDKIPVRLYFGGPDENSLEVEVGEIQKPSSTEESVRLVVERLLLGPRHLVSVIPKDTKIKNVYFDGKKTVYLNFSMELSKGHPGGAKIERLTIFSITNTVIANNPYVQEVKFLVGGKEIDTFAGHVNTYNPFRFNPTVVSQN